MIDGVIVTIVVWFFLNLLYDDLRHTAKHADNWHLNDFDTLSIENLKKTYRTVSSVDISNAFVIFEDDTKTKVHIVEGVTLQDVEDELEDRLDDKEFIKWKLSKDG